ncbi:MAG: DUF1361 domain-containing protein [Candidatus Paceibacterota bacterium]
MNFFKINISKSIILLIALSVVLNILRILIWNKVSFVYILWNIFLALLPFIISSLLLRANNIKKLNQTIFLIGGIFWLILIPNSPYIITDLIHIGEVRAVPALYDSFLLFSSAWVGLLLGMYSINHMEQILITKYSKKMTSIVLVFVILFTSFGMYLGRFLRFNSWDVFAKPISFLNGIREIFTSNHNLTEALLYTILFFFFILISYLSWKSTQTK